MKTFGPADFSPAKGEIHIWRLTLGLLENQASALERHLSAEELTRANAFHFTRDRQRFLATRGKLRELLGGYLRCEPASVDFTVGAHGKPQVADRDSDLRFNVSHSHEEAMIIAARGQEVGIDVELVRAERMSSARAL